MKNFNTIALSVLMSCSFVVADDFNVELTASKDTFARSTDRNSNSGASEYIMLAPMPGTIGLIAFDLSSITNEIISAEVLFRIHESSRTPLSLMVSPLVYNEMNPKWIEGTGNLGIRGQNATIGEATFQWRAFRDQPWQDNDGEKVVNLMSSDLWNPPIHTFSSVNWDEGIWLSAPMDDPALLEEIRTNDLPTVTFGIWGTSGNGVYKVSAKESGHPAKLSLTLKEN
ncbi:hypothetical protein P4C99_14160 [Pontiellaceae bacterium B1224]|nr:hypothetical protein [Pontiellaceae bacterium B1224]